jgi:WD40 repeat protein
MVRLRIMPRVALLTLLLAIPAVGQEPPLPAGAAGRVGSARMRHMGDVRALAYSPDGKRLATATASALHIHDAATGALQFHIRLPSQSDDTTAVMRFSDDGSRIFVSAGGTLVACELARRQFGFSHSLTNVQRCLAISPRGIALVKDAGGLWPIDLTTDRGRPKIADPPERSRTRHGFASESGEYHSWQREAAFPQWAEFTRHGLLASGQFVTCLYDPAGWKWRGDWVWDHTGEVAAATLSPDGLTLAAVLTRSPGGKGGLNASFVALDLRRGHERVIRDGLVGESFAFSSDATILAAVTPDGVLLIDVKSGRMLRTILGPARVSHLTFSPDGRTLAAACGSGVCQWDVVTGRRLDASAEPAGEVHRLRFIDSDRLRVFAGEIVEYDWRNNRALKRFPAPPHAKPENDDVSPDGSMVAIPRSSTVELVDPAGRVRQTIPAAGHCAFTADGNRLFIFGEWIGCRAWDFRTGALVQLVEPTPRHNEQWVTASDDGRLIATFRTIEPRFADEELAVRLFDGRSGTKLRDLVVPGGAASGLSFSSDGRRLATTISGSRPVEGSAGEAVVPAFSCAVWDTVTGKLVRPPWDLRTDPSCLALSPDGRTIACGSGDGFVSVWEVATGIERARFTGHPASIRCVAFSPCGRYLASAGPDGPILVWDLWAAPSGSSPPPAELWSLLTRDRTAAIAMQRLAAAPDVAVALLRDRVHAVAPVSDDRLRRLLADLDQPRYAARSAAAAELQRVADQVEAQLRRHVAAPDASAEARHQIQRLLEHRDEMTSEYVVGLRALEVLERVNTPAARALIAEWAAGAPAARFTREAAATLERLKR